VLRDLSSGAERRWSLTDEIDAPLGLGDVALNHDGTRVAVGLGEGEPAKSVVRVFGTARAGEFGAVNTFDGGDTEPGRACAITSLAIRPDGDQLVVGGECPGEIEPLTFVAEPTLHHFTSSVLITLKSGQAPDSLAFDWTGQHAILAWIDPDAGFGVAVWSASGGLVPLDSEALSDVAW